MCLKLQHMPVMVFQGVVCRESTIEIDHLADKYTSWAPFVSPDTTASAGPKSHNSKV